MNSVVIVITISNDLPQIFNFPRWISDCNSHILALLDLFISSDTSICSAVAFPPLGNSDHVFVSIFIDIPSNLKWNPLFCCTAYGYSRVDLDVLRDHLADVSREDIFKLDASVAATEFCE